MEPESESEYSAYIDDKHPEDTAVKATERLYQPKEKGIYGFLLKYFGCFTRATDDAFPDLDDSFSEPLPSNYTSLNNGTK